MENYIVDVGGIFKVVFSMYFLLIVTYLMLYLKIVIGRTINTSNIIEKVVDGMIILMSIILLVGCWYFWSLI